MELKIKYSTDDHSCETCGENWAEGVNVVLDNEEILNIPACASCFESSYVEDRDILLALCRKLGITVKVISYDFAEGETDVTNEHNPNEVKNESK